MAITFFALAVFCIGVAGIGYIAAKKIPVLLEFPVEKGIDIPELAKKAKHRIANLHIMKIILSPEIFLLTLLSKMRVYALRFEVKMSEWLMQLRKKSQEQSKKFSKKYWDQLKKKG